MYMASPAVADDDDAPLAGPRRRARSAAEAVSGASATPPAVQRAQTAPEPRRRRRLIEVTSTRTRESDPVGLAFLPRVSLRVDRQGAGTDASSGDADKPGSGTDTSDGDARSRVSVVVKRRPQTGQLVTTTISIDTRVVALAALLVMTASAAALPISGGGAARSLPEVSPHGDAGNLHGRGLRANTKRQIHGANLWPRVNATATPLWPGFDSVRSLIAASTCSIYVMQAQVAENDPNNRSQHASHHWIAQSLASHPWRVDRLSEADIVYFNASLSLKSRGRYTNFRALEKSPTLITASGSRCGDGPPAAIYATSHSINDRPSDARTCTKPGCRGPLGIHFLSQEHPTLVPRTGMWEHSPCLASRRSQRGPPASTS